MLVIAEYIVLGEPEALCWQPAEPRDELITPSKLSGHRVPTRDVPDNVAGEKGG
jgi:hypothetical protein